MLNERDQNGWRMMLLLAALDQIDFRARAEKLPSFDGYQFSGEDLPQLLQPLNDSAVGAVLDDFLTDLQPADLILVDYVQSIIQEVRNGLEEAIKSYEQEFGTTPVTAIDEPGTLDDMRQSIRADIEKLTASSDESIVSSMTEAISAPTINENNQVAVDTGLLSDAVPDTEIDPRTGTYQSESESLQAVLDAVSVVDSAVPTEIRSTATDVWNQVAEQVKDVGQH